MMFHEEKLHTGGMVIDYLLYSLGTCNIIVNVHAHLVMVEVEKLFQLQNQSD